MYIEVFKGIKTYRYSVKRDSKTECGYEIFTEAGVPCSADAWIQAKIKCNVVAGDGGDCIIDDLRM